MEKWKIKQQVYHRLNSKNLSDDLSNRKYVLEPKLPTVELVSKIILHFETDPEILYYPAKSYFVALLYAKLLKSYFKVDFYTTLDDKDLLYGNDPYFVPYSQDKITYDLVIKNIGSNIDLWDLTKGQCPCVVNYFNKEFFIK